MHRGAGRQHAAGRCRRCVPRAARGYRAVVASVRKLGHVPRLRGPWRSVRDGRAGACVMTAAAMPLSSSAGRHGRSARMVFDSVLLVCVSALLLLGLIMVTSASISIAPQLHMEPFAFLLRQLAFAAIGCCMAFCVFAIPSELW